MRRPTGREKSKAAQTKPNKELTRRTCPSGHGSDVRRLNFWWQPGGCRLGGGLYGDRPQELSI